MKLIIAIIRPERLEDVQRELQQVLDEADAGIVLLEPFSQAAMNEALTHMLNDDAVRRAWQANALAFADRADIYDNAEVAANVILKARP